MSRDVSRDVSHDESHDVSHDVSQKQSIDGARNQRSPNRFDPATRRVPNHQWRAADVANGVPLALARRRVPDVRQTARSRTARTAWRGGRKALRNTRQPTRSHRRTEERAGAWRCSQTACHARDTCPKKEGCKAYHGAPNTTRGDQLRKRLLAADKPTTSRLPAHLPTPIAKQQNDELRTWPCWRPTKHRRATPNELRT